MGVFAGMFLEAGEVITRQGKVGEVSHNTGSLLIPLYQLFEHFLMLLEVVVLG